MDKLLGFAILFGVIMAIRSEIKDYRWRKANPIEAAKWDYKING